VSPPASLTAAQRYELDVRGHLVVPGVLGTGELARLHAALEALALPPADGDLWSQRVGDLLGRGQPFVDLVDHPVALAAIAHVHGPYARLDHAYAIRMAPGVSGLGLHGGPVPWDPAQYYVHDRGGVRAGLVALQWALVDHPPGAGGFGCIPGSHRAGLPLPDGGVDHLVVEVPLRAGDVVLFTEALVHRTLTWQGPGERRTLLYKYSPASSTWAPSEELEAARRLPLTDRQRTLLQPPSVGAARPLW
jgi:hypothetical protein